MKKVLFPIKGKTIFLTGASGGLGEQLALTFAKLDASLILVARNETRLQAVADRCQQLTTGTVHYYACDLTDDKARAELLTQVGSMSVDVVVNNAGLGYFKDAVDLTPEEITRMLRLNLEAVIAVTQAFLPQLIEKKEGMIVQIASQSGKTATNKTSIYSATKFGVIGYSNALRLELVPHNVHVMTVNPGPIETNFFANAEPTGEYLGQLGPIVLSAQAVAWKIVTGMNRKKREVNLPRMMEVAARLNVVFPHIGDYLIRTIFNKK